MNATSPPLIKVNLRSKLFIAAVLKTKRKKITASQPETTAEHAADSVLL